VNPSLAARRIERSLAIWVVRTTGSPGSAPANQSSDAAHASAAYPSPSEVDEPLALLALRRWAPAVPVVGADLCNPLGCGRIGRDETDRHAPHLQTDVDVRVGPEGQSGQPMAADEQAHDTRMGAIRTRSSAAERLIRQCCGSVTERGWRNRKLAGRVAVATPALLPNHD
jgi:hypothetical protein